MAKGSCIVTRCRRSTYRPSPDRHQVPASYRYVLGASLRPRQHVLMGDLMSDNPLLKADFVIPFDDRSAPRGARLREALDLAKERLAALVDEPATGSRPLTYDNTLGALDEPLRACPSRMAGVTQRRGQHARATGRLQPGTARGGGVLRVFSITSAFTTCSSATGDRGRPRLTGVARRHLTKTLDHLRRAGAELRRPTATAFASCGSSWRASPPASPRTCSTLPTPSSYS